MFQGQNVMQPGSVLLKPTEKQEEGGGNTILEESLLPRMTGAREVKSLREFYRPLTYPTEALLNHNKG